MGPHTCPTCRSHTYTLMAYEWVVGCGHSFALHAVLMLAHACDHTRHHARSAPVQLHKPTPCLTAMPSVDSAARHAVLHQSCIQCPFTPVNPRWDANPLHLQCGRFPDMCMCNLVSPSPCHLSRALWSFVQRQDTHTCFVKPVRHVQACPHNLPLRCKERELTETTPRR